MVFRDAADPDAYAYTRILDGAQWAWEFLRRNPDYQAEWQAFDRVWRALEADYGRPPNRDFCAWQRDPRAWVRAADCPQGDCRVDRDKVLIECALGARWGFYKFPPDPADDDPVGAGRLAWRPLDQPVPVLGGRDLAWVDGDPARVALGFDLALPLRAQVEQAKRTLQLLQRRRQRSGEVRHASIGAWRGQLTPMLRQLDADRCGAAEDVRMAVGDDWRQVLAEACRVRDGGYRQLAFLPA